LFSNETSFSLAGSQNPPPLSFGCKQNPWDFDAHLNFIQIVPRSLFFPQTQEKSLRDFSAPHRTLFGVEKEKAAETSFTSILIRCFILRFCMKVKV